MPGTNLTAILLRRIEYGDYDLIVTLFSKQSGKVSAIAKSAKKSVKRFSGVLEPFSELEVVLSKPKGKGLPILKEAALIDPFFRIRADIQKTAYASYWLEMIYLWMADGEPLDELYQLARHVLWKLNEKQSSPEMLSILFQMRFLSLYGFRPNFDECRCCNTMMDKIVRHTVFADLSKGGVACENCAGESRTRLAISKGTLKQMRWLDSGSLERADRVRFTPAAVKEGLLFLEAFVPYHLGKEPKSLKVLRAVRKL